MPYAKLVLVSSGLLLDSKLARPERAVACSYKVGTCAGGSVPHLTVKEVTVSRHKRTMLSGPRVYLAGDSEVVNLTSK
jgi:hypothetical protein